MPHERCVELKSLKLYIWSFRSRGAFHEAVTNEILSDLVAATAPRFMRLLAEFNVRGGIYTTVVAEHRQSGWVLASPRYPALEARDRPAPPLPPEVPGDLLFNHRLRVSKICCVYAPVQA